MFAKATSWRRSIRGPMWRYLNKLSPKRDRVVGANGAPLARPVPVTAGTVEEKAFPIYRVGLGTVQAYNTVTVKVRVDGEVQKIVFREGQDVREGDLLAQIVASSARMARRWHA